MATEIAAGIQANDKESQIRIQRIREITLSDDIVQPAKAPCKDSVFAIDSLAGVEGVPTQVFDSVEAKLAAAQQALQALQCRLKDPGQIADAMYTSLSGTNGLSKYDPDRSLHCRAAMVSPLALRPNAKLVPDPVFSVRF